MFDTLLAHQILYRRPKSKSISLQDLVSEYLGDEISLKKEEMIGKLASILVNKLKENNSKSVQLNLNLSVCRPLPRWNKMECYWIWIKECPERKTGK